MRPLNGRWSFLLTYPTYGNTNDAAFRALGEFRDTSTFWGHYTHFLSPSFVFTRPECTRRPTVDGDVIEGLALFRDGIAPVWEDPHNTNGGHLQAIVMPWDRIDDVWDVIVKNLVANTEHCNDIITGARVVDKTRKGKEPVYRVEVWFGEDQGGQCHDWMAGLNGVTWTWVSHVVALDKFHARKN